MPAPESSSRPNLEFYKKQAKALLKACRRSDVQALARMRAAHPRFRDLTDETERASKLTLADAQHVVARENGAASWPEIKRKIANSGEDVPRIIMQWSEALGDRNLTAIDALLSQHPRLKYAEFYPREKLPHYHSATYGPLLWAVWIEDFDIVRLLLRHGTDPNHEYQSCLPILLASEAMSDLLIAHGADVNRYCVNGGTALLWGVADIRRARYLLAKGADVNIGKPNSGETPLMLLMGSENEDEAVAIADLLIRHGVNVNARTRSGLDDEPIYNHGNDQAISQGGMTALHLAAEYGKSKLAELLLRHGADPHVKTVSRRTVYFGPEDKPFPFEPFAGETPLDWAVRSGHEEVIRLLGGNLLDVLYWAAASGNEEEVERLLRQGADVNKLHGPTGKYPLDAAVAHGRRNICRILLHHGAKWKCDIADAVELGIPEVVQDMLVSEPSLKTPLLATPRKVLKWLVRGTPEQREILEHVVRADPHTEDDLVLAIGLRDAAGVRDIQSQFSGAVASALRTVPELACFAAWEPRLLEAVLDAGADIEARDEVFQGTPLHWAIKFDVRESVEVLLSRGADANAVLLIGDAGATPLLLVVQQRSECSMELVRSLLEHGAEPNWQMHNGYTALDILNQRWGRRPDVEYEAAKGIVRQYGGKTASELAIPS